MPAEHASLAFSTQRGDLPVIMYEWDRTGFHNVNTNKVLVATRRTLQVTGRHRSSDKTEKVHDSLLSVQWKVSECCSVNTNWFTCSNIM